MGVLGLKCSWPYVGSRWDCVTPGRENISTMITYCLIEVGMVLVGIVFLFASLVLGDEYQYRATPGWDKMEPIGRGGSPEGIVKSVPTH